MKKQEIVIVGGGIAGLSIALGLQNKGIPCKVYESAPELKPVGAGIGLSFNAVRACDKLGIRKEVKEAGHSVEQAWITDQSGKVLSCIDFQKHIQLFKEVSVLIHRHKLHTVLVSKLADNTLQLGKKMKAFQPENGQTRLNFEDGTSVWADYVIAADGINSFFRKTLVPGSLPRYAGYTCWRGISSFSEIYPYKQALIESWGKGRRLGIVPLKNNEVYWFAVINAPQNSPEMKNASKDTLLGFFPDWNPHYLKVLEDTSPANIIWNDISDIVPLRQFAYGNLVLTGDAAHATTPDLGQGGCQALEDAVVLSECMATSTDFSVAFLKFEQLRLDRTTKVIQKSRMLARIGQLENGFLTSTRNLLLQMTSEEAAVKQISWLAEIPF